MNRKQAFLLSLFLSLCIAFTKAWVLFTFSTVYTDNDQLILWIGARDFLQGYFPDFCFYGQAYNTMLEGYLAAPLVWSGIHYSVALPLITLGIGLIPWLIAFWFFFKHRAFEQAVWLLFFLLGFSPFLEQLSVLPRGFVTGFFACSSLLPSLFYRNDLRWFLVGMIIAPICFWLNPNCLILIVPWLISMCFFHYKKIAFYPILLTAWIPGKVFYSHVKHYYNKHPERIEHFKVNDEWSWSNLFDFLKNLPDWFDTLTPFVWNVSLITLFILAIVIGDAIMRRNHKKLVVVCGGLVFMLLCGIFTRIHDGLPETVFFHKSRMFLCFPFFMAIISANVFARLFKLLRFWLLGVLIVSVSLSITVLKFKEISRVSAFEYINSIPNMVEVFTVNELKEKVAITDSLAKVTGAEMVVLSDKECSSYSIHSLAYASEFYTSPYKPFIFPARERRTDFFFRTMLLKCSKVLFLNHDETFELFEKSNPLEHERIIVKGMSFHLVSTPKKQTLLDWCNRFDIEVRSKEYVETLLKRSVTRQSL